MLVSTCSHMTLPRAPASNNGPGPLTAVGVVPVILLVFRRDSHNDQSRPVECRGECLSVHPTLTYRYHGDKGFVDSRKCLFFCMHHEGTARNEVELSGTAWIELCGLRTAYSPLFGANAVPMGTHDSSGVFRERSSRQSRHVK